MSYFRRIKTTNETRASFDAEENGVTIRGKRAKLPNAWDDIQHARRGRSDRHKKRWR